jgi:hypothetical protein
MVKWNYFVFNGKKEYIYYARSKAEALEIAIRLNGDKIKKSDYDRVDGKYEKIQGYESKDLDKAINYSMKSSELKEIRNKSKEIIEKLDKNKETSLKKNNENSEIMKVPRPKELNTSELKKNMDNAGYLFLSYDDDYIYFIKKLKL